MGRLPNMRNVSRITRSLQTEFGSYNHTDSACNGDIYDMKNLSSEKFPLLTTRKKRKKENKPGTILSVSETGFNCFVYKDGASFDLPESSDIEDSSQKIDIIFVNGDTKYILREGNDDLKDIPPKLCSLGSEMLILPDKKIFRRGKLEDASPQITNITQIQYTGNWYNKELGSFSIDKITFTTDGYYEGYYDFSPIVYPGCVLKLRALENMDTVNLKVISVENNSIYTDLVLGTDELHNNENLGIIEFSDRIEFFQKAKKIKNEETGEETFEYFGISVEGSEIPDIVDFCKCDNRLWGFKGKTIYATALGKVLVWEQYAGLSTDSWTVKVADKSNFTGCFAFRGSPYFFNEEKMYRVYGDRPSNFQLVCVAEIGIESDSGKSLAAVGETLFFKSQRGIYAYRGGIPICISECFGEDKYICAMGIGSETKYYVYMKNISTEQYHLFVYDTRFGTWHKEDAPEILLFFKENGKTGFVEKKEESHETFGTAQWTYYLDNGNDELKDLESEEDVKWFCEFADIYEYSSYNKRSAPLASKKGTVRFYIRAELEEGASMKVEIKFDSEDNWQQVASELGSTRKRTCVFPIIPRRADHFRLKLSGTGDCTIHSITREYYQGSFM